MTSLDPGIIRALDTAEAKVLAAEQAGVRWKESAQLTKAEPLYAAILPD